MRDLEKRRETSRRYNETHRERLNDIRRARIANDPERQEYNKRKSREYRLANPEKVKLANVAWRLANQERLKGYSDRYRTKPENREKARIKSAAYHRDNPERVRETRKRTRLKLLYGLTPEKLDEMKSQQNYCCAICFRRLPLCVDHCHSSGNIRGLLCQVCNQALGMFQDSPTVLESAKTYLNRPYHATI